MKIIAISVVYFFFASARPRLAQRPRWQRQVAHRFQLTLWSYIQPDIQYVIDPRGTGDISDAVVIGAQMGVTFLNQP